MRAFIGSDEYQGTPKEIAQFLYTRELQYQAEPAQEAFLPSDFQPFEEIINDSESLRKKLENNPEYNPYAGVVSSKEGDPEATASALNAPFTAEEDTGVELK